LINWQGIPRQYWAVSACPGLLRDKKQRKALTATGRPIGISGLSPQCHQENKKMNVNMMKVAGLIAALAISGGAAAAQTAGSSATSLSKGQSDAIGVGSIAAITAVALLLQNGGSDDNGSTATSTSTTTQTTR
jgi:hypothetical protein